jgi:thiamine biosynthesis lipoprotein
MMDTFCTITVVSPSKKKAKEAIEAGFDEIKRLEESLNFFSKESELSAINRASGEKPVRVSNDTLEVIKKAVEIAGYTNGAFDPTIGPLSRLWGFSRQNLLLKEEGQKPFVPSKDKIINNLRLVDYKKIKINPLTSEIFLEETGMLLDLGGIAKGYAVDKAIESIKRKGIKAALVSIAGDIRAFGMKPGSKPWRVGIQNPRGEDVFVSLYLEDKAISTSGDYQRYFIKDGRRYHHILNPDTGYPASGVISVSVIAPEGYLADGLSTGVFVIGPEKGIRLLESLGVDGIIVDSNKKVFITDNLKGKINIEKNL